MAQNSIPTITHNLSTVLERIRRYEKKYGRPENSVQLIAISKTKTVAMIAEAFALGQCQFGENYVQEAEKKILALKGRDIIWHFIGPIQSNKAKKIARLFPWVHSVDRISIAEKLSAYRPQDAAVLNVCIQVNASWESTKSGVAPDDVYSVADAIMALPRLQLRGLMAILAVQTDFSRQRQEFSKLYTLYRSMEKEYHMDTLSIGMSADFEAAIAQGATLVRLGTAIFNARETG